MLCMSLVFPPQSLLSGGGVKHVSRGVGFFSPFKCSTDDVTPAIFGKHIRQLYVERCCCQGWRNAPVILLRLFFTSDTQS